MGIKISREKMQQIVEETLGVDKALVIDTAEFDNDLGMDSLDRVELVMAFEEETGVEISDEIAEKLNTIGDIVKALKKADLWEGE